MSIQKEPDYQQVMNLINCNRLNEAETLLVQIFSTETSSFIAYFQLGYIRSIQGRFEDATELVIKSLRLNPSFELGKQLLVKMEEQTLAINGFSVEPNAIYTYWYNQLNNWGDLLNVVLIEKLSGKKVTWVAPFDYRVPEKHCVIGSLFHSVDSHMVIWGTGVMAEDRVPAVKPKKICAVRGPLTRNLLIGRGIDCPEIYGDPALLYPRFYNPDIEKKYDIGIIAHYVDQDHPWLKYAESKGAKIINILGPINQVVDEIKSCARIASSSLHGIIAADAYGVPSLWVEFSDKVIGGGFKFRDYYMSINRPVSEPVCINNDTNIEHLHEGFNIRGIDIDLDILLESCPFRGVESVN